MAAQKIKDAAVKTGEYQDPNSGMTKGRWMNVGSLMAGDDGGQFLVIDRTFNPAGVPNPQNRPSVLISLFDPSSQGGGNNMPPAQQPPQGYGPQQQPPGQAYQNAHGGGFNR